MDEKIRDISKIVRKPKVTIIKATALISTITILIIMVSLYITNEEFRNSIDIYILKKSVTEENLNKIEINSEDKPNIYAYDKYIVIVNKSNLNLYNKDGSLNITMNVNINNPIVSSNAKYFALAEKKGSKLCLTSEANLLWQRDVDGEIAGINVNPNGYVSIIVTNTTYKSVIITYDPNGTELFRTFLSQKYAMCSTVSSDNKYLAVGEISYSGSVIKSSIKIISIEDAISKKENAIKKVYEAPNGEILINLTYDKDVAIAQFTNFVEAIKITENTKLVDIDKEILFLDIDLKKFIAIVEKENTGIFSNKYQLIIRNKENTMENLYIINEGLPKAIKTCGDKILINHGTQLEVVNKNGWLIKKYTSKQEIKDIVLSEEIVGVVFKDRIEIIEL